jgi:hypothetical protein
MIVATSDLASRLAEADVALWTSWMAAVRDLPGNRYGIEVSTRFPLTSLHVREIPIPYYNRVLGITPASVEEACEMIDGFRERFTPCRIDVNPFYSSPGLLTGLNSSGFHPSEFQTNLWGDPTGTEPIVIPGVTVREVRRGELDFFARLYERAYNGERAPCRLRRFRMDSIKARYEHPDWRFYLTLADGVPAGGGALHIADGVASLSGGATMFTLRGRGCQLALLNKRLLDAAEARCELVVSRCVVGSVSQRNMERAGLQTAYTKSIWEPRLLAA